MNLYRTFKRWLKSTPLHPVQLRTSATFKPDSTLGARLQRARDQLPADSIYLAAMARRDRIAARKPVDFDGLPGA